MSEEAKPKGRRSRWHVEAQGLDPRKVAVLRGLARDLAVVAVQDKKAAGLAETARALFDSVQPYIKTGTTQAEPPTTELDDLLG